MSKLIHRALMYEPGDGYLDTAAAFLREGIGAGDAILASGTTENVQRLRELLGSWADEVEFADSRLWYVQPTKTIAAYSTFVREHLNSRIRVIAEPGWQARTAIEVAEWTRYEALVNQAFADVDASVLCMYDRTALAPGMVDGGLCTHPELVDRLGAHSNDHYLDPGTVAARIDADPLPAPPPDTTKVPVDNADLSPLRSFISAYCKRHGMSRARVNDLLVAATEVATNAIRHGLPPMSCRLWSAGIDIVVEITDGGHWELDDVPGFIPPDPATRSGLGLWGVRMLCALVQVRTSPTGTTVRMHVPLG